MDAVLRIVLVIVGAGLGGNIGRGNEGVFALFGALIGLIAAELLVVRRRLRAMESQISTLSKGKARDLREPAATAPPPAARPSAVGLDSDADAQHAPTERAEPLFPIADPRTPRPGRLERVAARADEPGASRSEAAVIRLIREYFTGGNTLVRAGIIVLFFGIAFLLRFAAQHSHIPIEFRLAGVAFGALALLALGWYLRTKRPGYALALQGGAVGILYLTVFAAFRLYSILPATTAFGLLVLIAALSAALAVLQNSLAFALLGVTGGFLAPLLASTPDGSHIVLFSYYVVLNAGILAIAWFKAWRPLNVAGFVFTFVIGTAWGVLRYRPADFSTTEPFLIAFFLFYVAIAILFTLRQPPQLRGYVDGTLVFGTPIVAFGLQSAMLHERLFPLAYSALAVSALYLVIAQTLQRRASSTQRLLVEAFMALGIAFLTLAVPLGLSGHWSASTWALEGAALIWIGCRQNRRLPRIFGALLQIAAGGIICVKLDPASGHMAFHESPALNGLLVGAVAVFSAHTLHANRERLAPYERLLPSVLFVCGLLSWLVSGISEITSRVTHGFAPSAVFLFMTATALISSELHQRFRLAIGKYCALSLLAVMLWFAAMAASLAAHPFADGGWASWPIAFWALFVIVRRHEGAPGESLANNLHVLASFFLIAISTWEVAWAVEQAFGNTYPWPAFPWAIVATAALLTLPSLTASRMWPFAAHRNAYLVVGVGICVYLSILSLATDLLPFDEFRTVPYVPLLNPVDVAQGFVLLSLLRFWTKTHSVREALMRESHARSILAVLALLIFAWLNAALLRALHFWTNVAYSVDALQQSTLAQTAVTIFWAVLALTTMLIATRKTSRLTWLCGAALLVVVVAKLFLVDLARIDTLDRIISFVVVGLLMLVVGYFSPLPPARERAI